jgi:hypothetical protein
MQQMTVSLNATENLVVEWGSNWSNLSIRQNGQLIGSVQDPQDLKTGRRFSLPDGREILVIVQKKELEIWHDGKELVSGLQSGQKDDFKLAHQALIGIGILQLVIGLVVLLINSSSELVIGEAIVGSLFIGLGFWARMTGSKIPYWIGMVFCALNIVATVIMGSMAGILLLGILIYYLYKGTQADPRFSKIRKSGSDDPLDAGL